MARPGRRVIRVLVADDHRAVRENLTNLLAAEAEFDVVGTAGEGSTAVRLADRLRPDVLVIDHDLPGLDGIAVSELLRGQGNKARIVLYTMRHDVWEAATRSGVDVCVAKDDPAAALINSVRVLGRMRSRDAARVLVVEDDPDVRALMRSALEEDGHDIVTTGDGLEALAECERRAPEIVVLDLGLPEMSGPEFVSAYRRMPRPAAPLVVVSGASDARRIAADLGAAVFLPKPFSIEQLSEAVRRVRPAERQAYT